MPKLSDKEKAIISTLIIDNGSQYLNKIDEHVKDAAKKRGVERSKPQNREN
jgi:hypothetical protein